MFNERVNKGLKIASGILFTGGIATLILSEPLLINKMLDVITSSQQALPTSYIGLIVKWCET